MAACDLQADCTMIRVAMGAAPSIALALRL
jgi:hypothetical protein